MRETHSSTQADAQNSSVVVLHAGLTYNKKLAKNVWQEHGPRPS